MVAGMTAQHTPEPWVAGFGLIEESEEVMFGIGLPTLPTWTPIAILSTQRKLNATDTANAERIVTCVNACAGISNEALQQKGMSLLTDIIKNQQTTIESLRQQLASRDAEVAKAFEDGRQAEREECAKACEEGTALTAFQSKDCYSYAYNRAAAIRARSTK
jgi:hypothetical protein